MYILTQNAFPTTTKKKTTLKSHHHRFDIITINKTCTRRKKQTKNHRRGSVGYANRANQWPLLIDAGVHTYGRTNRYCLYGIRVIGWTSLHHSPTSTSWNSDTPLMLHHSHLPFQRRRRGLHTYLAFTTPTSRRGAGAFVPQKRPARLNHLLPDSRHPAEMP